MSLISEALRKVRQENPGVNGTPGGRMYPPSPPPQRPPPGLGLAIGVLVGAAATIAGGAVVWWALSRPAAEGPTAGTTAPVEALNEASSAAPPTTAPTPVAAAAGSGAQRSDPGASNAPAPLAADAAREEPDEAGAETRVTATTPPQQPIVVAETPATTAQHPAEPTPPPTPARGADGELVFVLDAQLGDLSLSLDYIVFRPSNPFAAINGHDVFIGSVVEGFRVDEIEQHHVRLTSDHQTVIIRTR